MFKLKAPCENCPFRNDKLELQGWLGEHRAQGIFDSIKIGGFFPCHKTTHTKNDDWDEDDDNETFKIKPHHQFCAGALILLEKLGITETLQPFQISERLGFYDRNNLRIEESAVFDNESDFVLWHK